MADEVAAPAAPAAPAVPVDAAPKALKVAGGTHVPIGKPEAAKVEAKTPDKAPPVESPKHKVKVNGKEAEVTLEDLIRGYQLREASDEKFRESDKLKKEAEGKYGTVNDILKLAQTDPKKFAAGMKNLGVDGQQLALGMLEDMIQAELEADEEAKMTPEQKANKDLQKQLKAYQEKEVAAQKAEEERAKQEEATKHQAAVDEKTEQWGEAIRQALEQTKLPKSPEVAMQLIDLVEFAVSHGLEVDAKHLVKDLESREAKRANALRDPDMLDPEFKRQIMLMAKDDPEIREMIRKASVEEFTNNELLKGRETAQNGRQRFVEKKDEPKRAKTFGGVQMEIMKAARAWNPKK